MMMMMPSGGERGASEDVRSVPHWIQMESEGEIRGSARGRERPAEGHSVVMKKYPSGCVKSNFREERSTNDEEESSSCLPLPSPRT